MGFLSFLRGESAKDIRVKQDISKYLVFPFYPKRKVLWLNKKAIVPEGFELAICERGRPLDFLPTGEHTLGAVILPNSTKKFKLYKLNKKGQSPDYFKGFAYFVNKTPLENFTFTTFGKLRYKNEVDGKFWAKMQFALSMQVENSNKLLQYLLMEFAYLKPLESEKIMRMWLGEFVTTELQKDEHRRDDFSKNLPALRELISAKVDICLKSFGVKFLNLEITNVVLSPERKNSKEVQIISPTLSFEAEAKLEEAQENLSAEELPDSEVDYEKIEKNSAVEYNLLEKSATENALKDSENALKSEQVLSPKEETESKVDLSPKYNENQLSADETAENLAKKNNSWQGLEKFWK